MSASEATRAIAEIRVDEETEAITKESGVNMIGRKAAGIVGAALRRAVLRLPEDLRLVVVMHYFNGFSVPEMAKTIQSPEGTVYYRLHEARLRIRNYLSKVFEAPGIKSSEGARQ